MGKIATTILIVIVGLLAFWFINENVPIEQESPTPTASVTPVDQTVSTPEITFSYGGDFDLAISPNQILTNSFIPSCADNFDYCLYYKGMAYQGTNFDSAGLRIDKREDLNTRNSCLNTQPAGYSDLRPIILDRDEYSTVLMPDLADAATGHYSNGNLYRLWFGSSCYEFETRIGESQFANHPAGSISEFKITDRADMMAKLRGLLDTITISNNQIKPTWPTSSSSRADYVKRELQAASIDSASFDNLLFDRRFFIYPKQSVTYKEPNWQPVKDKIHSQTSVQKGADYIRANLSAFQEAETEYGVPKEALAGLIALETDFGNNSGNYLVFNALYSRMLQWPETTWRAQAEQLAAFVKYCTGSGIDCFSVRGSYAGAFGIVQFMPNSLLAYGVDGNNDGTINLSRPVDAIPSAARYLKEHGWSSDPARALARYYGSAEGYPEIVLTYAELLKNAQAI